jgi:hypothetical protein
MELTPKQLELKKENHYVWAAYLKNWSLNSSMYGIQLKTKNRK